MVDIRTQACYNIDAVDYRTVKGEKCLSCGGKIGYFPDSDEFKCLTCRKPYNPSETKATESRKRFWASPRGREIQQVYFQTEKGTEARRRHQKTVKGKLTLKRYYFSDKGQKAHQKHQDKVKLFKAVDAWLKEHPDKTLQDFIKEHPNVEVTK